MKKDDTFDEPILPSKVQTRRTKIGNISSFETKFNVRPYLRASSVTTVQQTFGMRFKNDLPNLKQAGQMLAFRAPFFGVSVEKVLHLWILDVNYYYILLHFYTNTTN